MTKGDIVVTPLDTPVCALGEGPVWVEKENAVYWTDS
jgi:sugar lactone lactonase YvrE